MNPECPTITLCTRTDALKRWFGNSAVKNRRGNPLAVYHGTSAPEFHVFDHDKSKTGYFFFSKSRDVAQSWADEMACEASEGVPERRASVMEVYLSFQDPLLVATRGAHWSEIPSPFKRGEVLEIDTLAHEAQSRGFDSLIVRGVLDSDDTMDEVRSTTFVAFENTQIKSGSENIGTYDPEDPDIRH